MKKIKLSKLFRIMFIIFVVVVFLYLGASFSSFIDNGERVAPNTDLTYYIDVTYDGKDANAVTSSGTVTASVLSDYIFVEDVLPYGVNFVGFVQPTTGTEIGATLQEDESVSCSGYVVDGVNGLSYNSTTRTVSFKVKNLQAGCKLTVGVITKTPSLGNSDRLDFYSTAYAKENDFSLYSNTTHTLMGLDSVMLYSLEYAYEGDVPENAPELPTGGSYTYGSTVSLVSKPKVDGYTFNGWRIQGITINSNNTFTMPDNNVIAVGSFTKSTDYTVSYSLTDDVVPVGYELPEVSTYSPGDYFKIDTLKSGDVINGYVFSGWNYDTLSNCMIDNDNNVDCLMPSSNVELTGHFERLKHSVSYEFIGDDIPENASELLPTTAEYTPGDTVTVAADPKVSGYSFLGWYKSATFEMPEEDVVIYGEWMAQNGSFAPTIEQALFEEKNSFVNEDEIVISTTITNNSEFEIYEVLLEEKTQDFAFLPDEAYLKLNDNFINIPSIPAGGSVTVYSHTIAKNDYYKVYTHQVELIGATANDGYFLDMTVDYLSNFDYVVANINLDVSVLNEDGENLEVPTFELYVDETFAEPPIDKGLSFENLEVNTNYYLKQIKAQSGYVMSKTITIKVGEDAEITTNIGTVEKNDEGVLLTVINEEIDMLPQTGGIGNVPFVVVGFTIILVNSALYVIYLKRKENKNDNKKANSKKIPKKKTN